MVALTTMSLSKVKAAERSVSRWKCCNCMTIFIGVIMVTMTLMWVDAYRTYTDCVAQRVTDLKTERESLQRVVQVCNRVSWADQLAPVHLGGRQDDDARESYETCGDHQIRITKIDETIAHDSNVTCWNIFKKTLSDDVSYLNPSIMWRATCVVWLGDEECTHQSMHMVANFTSHAPYLAYAFVALAIVFMICRMKMSHSTQALSVAHGLYGIDRARQTISQWQIQPGLPTTPVISSIDEEIATGETIDADRLYPTTPSPPPPPRQQNTKAFKPGRGGGAFISKDKTV